MHMKNGISHSCTHSCTQKTLINPTHAECIKKHPQMTIYGKQSGTAYLTFPLVSRENVAQNKKDLYHKSVSVFFHLKNKDNIHFGFYGFMP